MGGKKEEGKWCVQPCKKVNFSQVGVRGMLPWLASLNACDDDLVAGQVNLLCVNEGVAGPSEARKQNHMFFEFLLFLAHHWHGMALGRERERENSAECGWTFLGVGTNLEDRMAMDPVNGFSFTRWRPLPGQIE